VWIRFIQQLAQVPVWSMRLKARQLQLALRSVLHQVLWLKDADSMSAAGFSSEKVRLASSVRLAGTATEDYGGSINSK